MNFNAPDFKDSLGKIQDKLDSGIDLSQITNAGKLPELSEFSKLAQGLLPENLIKVGEDGKLGLPTLNELQQSLNNGLTDIKGYLETEINGVFNSIVGEVQSVYNEAKGVYDELSNLATSIQNDSSIVTDLALSTLNNATGLNVNVQDLSNIKNSISNTIESFTKLSPKKVKDLADPNFYGRMVNATLNTSLDVAGKTAELVGLQSMINDQMDNSGYGDLFKSAIESGKNILPKEKDSDDTKYKLVVSRTVYWSKGEGATPESSAKKANSGSKLVDDYSLLVDNAKILIGSKVKFDDDKKEREAVDVATPSKGISISAQYPTVAIFFDTKEKAQAYMKAHPNKNVNATITVPSQKEKQDKNKIKEKAKETKKQLTAEERKSIEEKIAELEKKAAELEKTEKEN